MEAIKEAVKEGLRIALFAAIAAVVAWGTDKLSGMDPDSTFVLVGTVVLRLADKFVHENEKIETKGIAPF